MPAGWLLLFWVLLMAAPPAHAERLKDLATLTGARSNQLLGYGLVVGLAGTGDDISAGIGNQSVATMLRRLGVNVDPQLLRLRNVAAVMVTAELPAFVGPGQRLDVNVGSLGNARSLEGGTLLATPLKGADLKVYAVGQGPLSVGGFLAGGNSGSRIAKNVTTVGRVPNGALVEREVPVEMPHDQLSISLRSPDFTTAVRIATSIDKKLMEIAPAALPANAQDANNAADANSVADANFTVNPNAVGTPNNAAPPVPWAVARDSGTVLVRIPPHFVDRVPSLMAELEFLQVNPDWLTKVVINERTGTVVLGDSVRLAPVAIAHGGLTLEVKEMPAVSQPNAFGRGQTTVVPQTTVAAHEGNQQMQALAPGASLGEVVKALNTLGVSPRDLVAILQALKTSGALRAELEIQ